MKLLLNSHEAAGVVTRFALGTLFLDQFGDLSLFPLDGINRACLETGPALDTFLGDYLPQEQLLAAV